MDQGEFMSINKRATLNARKKFKLQQQADQLAKTNCKYKTNSRMEEMHNGDNVVSRDFLKIVPESRDDCSKNIDQIVSEINRTHEAMVTEECLNTFRKFRKKKGREWRPTSPVDPLKISRNANDFLLKSLFDGTPHGARLAELRKQEGLARHLKSWDTDF